MVLNWKDDFEDWHAYEGRWEFYLFKFRAGCWVLRADAGCAGGSFDRKKHFATRLEAIEDAELTCKLLLKMNLHRWFYRDTPSEDWQDEDRVYVEVERYWACRIDCCTVPG